VIQGRLQKFFKIVDTCGVHNLHGMPGLLGGVAAIAIIPGIAKAQLVGIIVTVVIALVGGIVSGYIIRAFGSKEVVYEDGDEFANTQG
jgi:ammonium transporter Rh